MDGAVHGLRGAAEHEILMGEPAGASTLIMGAFALGAYVLILLIALSIAGMVRSLLF